MKKINKSTKVIMTYEHGLHIDWQTKELINIKLKKKQEC